MQLSGLVAAGPGLEAWLGDLQPLCLETRALPLGASGLFLKPLDRDRQRQRQTDRQTDSRQTDRDI